MGLRQENCCEFEASLGYKLSQEKRKGKIVRSSRLSPKGQKLLQLCPMDKKVEEKLLESCLCSEKESVLTFRAALQKCPGQGLRTREGEGQRG